MATSQHMGKLSSFAQPYSGCQTSRLIRTKVSSHRRWCDLQGIAGKALQEIVGLDVPLLEGPAKPADSQLNERPQPWTMKVLKCQIRPMRLPSHHRTLSDRDVGTPRYLPPILLESVRKHQ